MEASAGGYQTRNPDQGLAVRFEAGGVALGPLRLGDAWVWSLSLSGYGEPGRVRPVAAGERVAQGTRLEYRRGAVTEWYDNRPEGIEQGFTLSQPPRAGAEAIELRLRLHGTLHAELDPDGRGARLKDSRGQAVLAYRQLDVVDARGRHLPARMALADDGLSLRVDTRNAAWPITVDPLIYDIQQKLTAQNSDGSDDPDKNGNFGVSVAQSADGSTVLVGAEGARVGGKAEAGAAYVYSWSGSEWRIQQKLTAQNADGREDPDKNANFGRSVALSGDGNQALIGAANADIDGKSHAGAVYAYQRTGTRWQIQQKLQAQSPEDPDDVRANANFGHAVALSVDGGTALIGADGGRVSGKKEAGAAYVYGWGGAAWAIQAKLIAQRPGDPDDARANANFGHAVALSSDGGTALIGADDARVSGKARAGAAYVYGRDGNGWAIQAKLIAQTPSDPDDSGANASFGEAVALSADGNTALVGADGAKMPGTGKLFPNGKAKAGAAYIYRRSEGGWQIQQKLLAQKPGTPAEDDTEKDAFFGQAVALSADGATALIGANGADGPEGQAQAGAAYVYSRTGTDWSIQQKLRAQTPDGNWDAKANGLFGYAAALSPDADTVLVGANAGAGAVYVFNPSQYTLAVTMPANGKITSAPPGISCGGASTLCSKDFPRAATVTLTAAPNKGYVVAGWTGCDSSSGPTCTMTMNAAKSVTATFSAGYSLTVSQPGGGGGTVTSNPAGINCGNTCSSGFVAGTVVTLNPQPASGYAFQGWSGCDSTSGSGNQQTCTVTINAARAVTATFGPLYALTVNQVGGVGVRLLSNPSGIDCGSTCSGQFVTGTVVILRSQTAPGYVLTGWTGCDSTSGSGNQQTCTVTMSAARSVTATFSAGYSLTVTQAGGGGGTVTSNPAGINCGGNCSSQFVTGTVVTLTSQTAAGYLLTGWTGCDSTSGSGNQQTCTVTMNAARSVTPQFSTTLTVNRIGGAGGGVVVSSPNGIACGGFCTSTFAAGTAVTLTLQPASDGVFEGWTGCDSTSGSGNQQTCTVILNGAKSVTATFVTLYTLTVNRTDAPTNFAGGPMSSSPPGVNCGGACSYTFAAGTQVTLTAEALPGYALDWLDCDSKTANTCTVTMNSNRTVVAWFGEQ
ncbi:MAG: hypothetical protein AB1648_04215 [Pseudomonadota bacterium]